jgi:hypothetical protein
MPLSLLERRNLKINYRKQYPIKYKLGIRLKKTTIYRILRIIEAENPVLGSKTTLKDNRVCAKLKTETQGLSGKSYRSLYSQKIWKQPFNYQNDDIYQAMSKTTALTRTERQKM